MIDVRAMQRRLTARGYAVAIDGALGPKTYAALFNCMAQRNLKERAAALGQGAAKYFATVPIDTDLRLIHFLGQTCVESMSYRSMRELWGPTPAQTRYEGREDLGNTRPGDGMRFMGRGMLQITGRANYAAVAARLGLDLVNHPELAEQPDIAVATACDYWKAHQLNLWADRDDTLALSRAINCGNPHSTRTPNGLGDRQAATARARVIVKGAS